MNEQEAEIQRTLGRIEEKLDMVLPRLNNHAFRIGKLERWQSRILGGAAVLGFLAGIAVAIWKA